MPPHEPTSSPAGAVAAVWRAARGHPVISVAMTLLVAGGMLGGVLLLPEEWSLVRRLVGGAFSGAGVGLLITAYRIIG